MYLLVRFEFNEQSIESTQVFLRIRGAEIEDSRKRETKEKVTGGSSCHLLRLKVGELRQISLIKIERIIPIDLPVIARQLLDVPR